MAITLSQLISTGALRLHRAGSATGNDSAPIQWVAVTELENPSLFLSGGEVVLTTGLRQHAGTAQRRFVRRIHEAGALAIGFGVGLSHARIPAALLAEADALGLPVFEVPYETPFIAIGKLVADALAADHYARLEQLLKSHRALAAALLSGGGLAALLATLSDLLSAELVLTQFNARILGSAATTDPAAEPAAWTKLPISTGMKDAAVLWVHNPFPDHGVVEYAQSLISVELRNLAEHRSAQRRIAGQVLQDIVSGSLTGQDAVVRLSGIGIHAGARHHTLLVEAPAAQQHLLATLALPGFAAAAGAVTAGHLVLILPVSAEAPRHQAQRLSDYLGSAAISARVGMGGAYPHAGGLRWSYFEAREALGRGKSVNEPERLSLTSLLLASEDVPLADLAEEVLGPLLDFDAGHDAGLLATLQCYLDANGSVAAVAAQLGLHRNTVRYRLGQIVELTGYDPAATADRVQFWLALSVRRLASPGPAC